jgi:hypothetical protein
MIITKEFEYMFSKNKLTYKAVTIVALMSVFTFVPLANQIGFSSVPEPYPKPPQSPCVVFGETTEPNQTVIIRSNEANELIPKESCQSLVDELVEELGFRVINTSEFPGCECFEWILRNYA